MVPQPVDPEVVFTVANALPMPIWLIAHRELHTSRRIRVVFDLLAEELSRPVETAGAASPRSRAAVP